MCADVCSLPWVKQSFHQEEKVNPSVIRCVAPHLEQRADGSHSDCALVINYRLIAWSLFLQITSSRAAVFLSRTFKWAFLPRGQRSSAFLPARSSHDPCVLNPEAQSLDPLREKRERFSSSVSGAPPSLRVHMMSGCGFLPWRPIPEEFSRHGNNCPLEFDLI